VTSDRLIGVALFELPEYGSRLNDGVVGSCDRSLKSVDIPSKLPD
jgi:hypothetical protein